MEKEQVRFRNLEEIGEGAFGVVSKAEDIKTGRLVALKRVLLDEEEEGIPNTTIREISLLKTLKHSNVVTLHDVVYHENELTLVFELMEQDLKQYIAKNRDDENGGLEPEVIRNFMRQFLEAVNYIHGRKILHRDLKPQNLLINNKNVLKIADFGMARACGIPVRNYTNAVVTLWYRSPVVLLGDIKYTDSLDIWSVGCIFAEMSTGSALFKGSNDANQLETIFKRFGSPSKRDIPNIEKLPEWKPEYRNIRRTLPPVDREVLRLGDQARDLLKRLLHYSARRRISAARALKHPYFI